MNIDKGKPGFHGPDFRVNMIEYKLPTGWVLKENPDAIINFRDKLSKIIAGYNNSITGVSDDKNIEMSLIDNKGLLVGGLAGRTSLGVLFINLLYVPEVLRGQGIGAELLTRAEKLAIGRGCTKAVLFTMSLQSPGFYSRFGYEKFGVIDCLPEGNSRIYMSKSLEA